MPPKRRSGNTRSAATRQQQTLSFHGKGSRVTKSTAGSSESKLAKKDPSLLEDAVLEELDVHPKTEKLHAPDRDDSLPAAPDPLEADGDVKVEQVLGGRAHESDTGAVGGKNAGWVGNEEAEARKLSDAQIKKYWRLKEQERLAPRVHQEGLTLNEKVLREWDMSGQYGPCIGIARLKRWKRANMLDMKPPLEVLAVLLKEIDRGNGRTQTSHVDELMNSRFTDI
ncbi:hypothetical protein K431DRAFT_251864 [Polychaeton citri CBS 116435]|uniref:DNA polymerase delta subunit 4 n=1 Tax=Polychaeton citri CBS 116435 TaxID=1314669 RepID=A0A9P4Q3J8_9PEZI|nr:hypothetical protein K431DRAFT_251864 [Polychaeton citri CBS 116435]